MRRFQDHTTVESCHGGDIILIGEEHGNSKCESLAEDVIDDVEPGVFAVEMPPRSPVSGRGAMGAVRRAANAAGEPVINIDIENRSRKFKETTDERWKLTRRANVFSEPIEEDGNLEERAIWDARARVKAEFGADTWRIMYPIREAEMARQLLTANRQYDGRVVAAIGAFHVPAVSRFLVHEEPLDDISTERIRR